MIANTISLMHLLRGLIGIGAVAAILSDCCSIVIPPVTLTGNKTAIEKQIIGEKNELEKDVWMISSAKTTSTVNLDLEDEKKRAKKEKSNSYAFEALYLISIFGPKLDKLKADRVAGENNKGYITNLLSVKSIHHQSEVLTKYDARFERDPDKGRNYRTLVQTVKQINRARTLMAGGFIEDQKKKNRRVDLKIEKLVKQQRRKYQDGSLKGSYIQLDNGRWVQK